MVILLFFQILGGNIEPSLNRNTSTSSCFIIRKFTSITIITDIFPLINLMVTILLIVNALKIWQQLVQILLM